MPDDWEDDSSPVRIEPDAEMRTWAIRLKQMQVALIDAGFPDEVAIEMIKEVIRSARSSE